MDDLFMFDAPYDYNYPYNYYECQDKPPPPTQAQAGPHPLPPPPQSYAEAAMAHNPYQTVSPRNKRGDTPRQIRNSKEKQRRDKLNQSIAELAAMVPPVVASNRKIDKTGVLRLTAHYLRAHQYVFGESAPTDSHEFTQSTADAVLSLLNGFLLTTTYRGLIVVVSQNITQYLGYTELDLYGQSLFKITHKDDHETLRKHLMPQLHLLGPRGELLVPDDPSGREIVEDILRTDQRRFVVRLKKQSQRSEPAQYVICHVEGSFRKSDKACHSNSRCCQVVRRTRARADNPCSSGNDVVFIGVVRPAVDTFVNESQMESFRMEYRTRHSIDGEIIQCEQRIAMVTGYMVHEVHGVNAMNFMHKDDVQWVIVALREMYEKKRLFGESCYRLMTKNGQFIYMRTRGCLDVEKDSCAITTFVCTNTVVGEREGKHLIKLMKKKFIMTVKNEQKPMLLDSENKDDSDNGSFAITDPRLLEKDILNLVTDLPSCSSGGPITEFNGDFAHSLALVPPNKERIVTAIKNIYTVITNFPKDTHIEPGPSFAISPFDVHSTQTENFLKPAIPTSLKNPFLSRLMQTTITTTPTSFEDAFMPKYGIRSDFEDIIPTTASTYAGPRFVTSATVTSAEANKQIGVKRSIESMGCESSLKKKINDENQALDVAGSPDLEKFLDEAISSPEFQHIDTALESLEQSFDPNFPDLLWNDVQDILGDVEDDPTNGQGKT